MSDDKINKNEMFWGSSAQNFKITTATWYHLPECDHLISKPSNGGPYHYCNKKADIKDLSSGGDIPLFWGEANRSGGMEEAFTFCPEHAPLHCLDDYDWGNEGKDGCGALLGTYGQCTRCDCTDEEYEKDFNDAWAPKDGDVDKQNITKKTFVLNSVHDNIADQWHMPDHYGQCVTCENNIKKAINYFSLDTGSALMPGMSQSPISENSLAPGVSPNPDSGMEDSMSQDFPGMHDYERGLSSAASRVDHNELDDAWYPKDYDLSTQTKQASSYYHCDGDCGAVVLPEDASKFQWSGGPSFYGPHYCPKCTAHNFLNACQNCGDDVGAEHLDKDLNCFDCHDCVSHQGKYGQCTSCGQTDEQYEEDFKDAWAPHGFNKKEAIKRINYYDALELMPKSIKTKIASFQKVVFCDNCLILNPDLDEYVPNTWGRASAYCRPKDSRNYLRNQELHYCENCKNNRHLDTDTDNVHKMKFGCGALLGKYGQCPSCDQTDEEYEKDFNDAWSSNNLKNSIKSATVLIQCDGCKKLQDLNDYGNEYDFEEMHHNGWGGSFDQGGPHICQECMKTRCENCLDDLPADGVCNECASDPWNTITAGVNIKQVVTATCDQCGKKGYSVNNYDSINYKKSPTLQGWEFEGNHWGDNNALCDQCVNKKHTNYFGNNANNKNDYDFTPFDKKIKNYVTYGPNRNDFSAGRPAPDTGRSLIKYDVDKSETKSIITVLNPEKMATFIEGFTEGKSPTKIKKDIIDHIKSLDLYPGDKSSNNFVTPLLDLPISKINKNNLKYFNLEKPIPGIEPSELSATWSPQYSTMLQHMRDQIDSNYHWTKDANSNDVKYYNDSVKRFEYGKKWYIQINQRIKPGKFEDQIKEAHEKHQVIKNAISSVPACTYPNKLIDQKQDFEDAWAPKG